MPIVCPRQTHSLIGATGQSGIVGVGVLGGAGHWHTSPMATHSPQRMGIGVGGYVYVAVGIAVASAVGVTTTITIVSGNCTTTGEDGAGAEEAAAVVLVESGTAKGDAISR